MSTWVKNMLLVCVFYICPLKKTAFVVYDRVTGLGMLTLEEMMWGYNTPPPQKKRKRKTSMLVYINPLR